MATKEKRYIVDQYVHVQELELKMNVREEEGYELVDKNWSGDCVTLVWEKRSIKWDGTY